MRIAILTVLSALVFGGLVQAQEVQNARYELVGTLHPQTHVLEATQTVDYPNDGPQPLETLYFWLWPNLSREPNPYLDPLVQDAGYAAGFDPAWLEVDAVTDGTGPLDWAYVDAPAILQTYSLERGLLRVRLGTPLAPGARTTVKITFKTHFPAALSPDESVHRDTFTWRFGWNPVAVPAAALGEGSVYPDPARPYVRWLYPAALYELRLTVPAEFEVASGLTLQEETLQGELKTLHLKSEVPVRSAPLSLSPAYRRYTLKSAIAPVTVFYRPGEEAAARQLATYAVEILEAYAARWGAYGYPDLTVVSSWSPGLWGMAADGFIVLGNGAFSEKDLTVAGMSDRIVEYLLAHEIAHQWWGIGVGADFNAENYLSEAFAEYLAITYFEDKYGADGPNLIRFEREGLLEKAIESQLGFLNLRQHFSELPYLTLSRDRFDEALVKPFHEVEYLNANAVRLYNKGYLVLRALAGLLGPQKMDELLRTAYRRFNHGLFDTAQLRALAEEVSGQDLERFFAHWVYGAAEADYAIARVRQSRTEDDKYVRTEVQLVQRGASEVDLPVQVVFISEKDERVEKTWRPSDPNDVLTFVSLAPAQEIQVDPQSLVPDVNRLNNYHPTRIRVLPNGGNALPLDAYLIRVNPMSQSIEGGFLNDFRWLLANNFAAFVLNRGRGERIDGALRITENSDFLADLAWTLTRFHHPQIGLTARYWEPVERLRLSLARRLDEDGRAVNFAGLDYRWNETLRHVVGYRLELLSDGAAFARLSAGAAQRTLLWPQVTLDAALSVGLGVGRLPGILNFTLGELQAFTETDEQGRRHKLTFPGRYKALARVGVNFPLKRDWAYNLLGLALARRVDGTVYLTAAQTWNAPGGPPLEDVKLEAGFEATLSGSSLGGLFPWQVGLGVAVPLWPRLEEAAVRFQPYVSLGLPLL